MKHTWKTAIVEALKSLQKPAKAPEILEEIQRLGLIDVNIATPLETIRSILYRASTRKDEYTNPSSEILFKQTEDGRWVLFGGSDAGDAGPNEQITELSDGGTGIEEETIESGELITKPFDASAKFWRVKLNEKSGKIVLNGQ